jgi:patatin-like phospholipase
MEPDKIPYAEQTFPAALRDAEATLLRQRPIRQDARVGLALSGGGIRSATFALGVLQTFARNGLVRHVDYLSTVSGGGYIGSALGRLFTRHYVQTVDDVERILSGPPDATSVPPPDRNDPAWIKEQAGWKFLGWLRENGRYMAPRGAGDLLLAGAILIRNLVSIHVVLGTLILAVMLLMQLPRVLAYHPFESWRATWWFVNLVPLPGEIVKRLPLHNWIWWSPWTVLSFAVLALSIPFGWAYWLAGKMPPSDRPLERLRMRSAWVGIVVSAAIGVIALMAWKGVPPAADITLRPQRIAAIFAYVLGGAALAAAGCFFLARSRTAVAGTSHTDPIALAAMRHWLSNRTMVFLVSGAGIFGVAAIDSLAQTIYAQATEPDELRRWAAAIFASVTALAAGARQFVVLSNGKAKERPSIPVSIVAALLAFVLTTAVLVGWASLAHAIAWDFGVAQKPNPLGPAASGVVSVTAPASHTVHISVHPDSTTRPAPIAARARPRRFLAWLLAVTVLAIAFGNAFTFLNQSAQLSLYSARLTRAYLGASNDLRWRWGGTLTLPVVDPAPRDDVTSAYWGVISAESMRKGMPLHIVNTTINETFDGQSQVQQQDRKGTILAIGPGGFSVGCRHHLVFDTSGEPR